MGFFRDLMRDVEESGLTTRERELRSALRLAREREAERQWHSAGYHFEQAEQWEPAGDAYMEGWKRQEGGYVHACPPHAAECYYKAGKAQKMRRAYLECLKVNAWLDDFTRNCVERLIDTRQLEEFVREMCCSFEDFDREANGLHHSQLVDELKRRGHVRTLAQILSHFPRSLWKRDDILADIIRAGLLEEAALVATQLADAQLLTDRDFEVIVSAFVEQRAAQAALESSLRWFAVHPEHAVDFGQAPLRSIGQWETFLQRARVLQPAKLGKKLHYLSFHDERQRFTEVEAEILEACCGACGEKDWVGVLVKFWRERGDLRRAATIVTRFAVPTVAEGDRLYDDHTLAYILADGGDSVGAAEAMERWATRGLVRDDDRPSWLYQAAKLYEFAGKVGKAASLYTKFGRTSKAQRLTGGRVFNLDETRLILGLIRLPDPTLIRSRTAKHRSTGTKADELLSNLESSLDDWSHFEDWFVVLLMLRDDSACYRATLERIERRFRRRGRWYLAASILLGERLYDDFDRLCREEDELEVAAAWYKKTDMPERAVRIHEELAGGGVAGVAEELAIDVPQTSRFRGAKDGEREPRACPGCGKPIRPNPRWRSCPECHAPLVSCSACGEPLKPEWPECPACTTPARPVPHGNAGQ